ncbi:MAG: phenylacetate--CoA ligase family protein [Aestuariivirga sp.]
MQSPADILRVQEERWARQAEHIRHRSTFYRALRLTGRIDEIAGLPFTEKDTLRADQRDHPPFGSYLAADPETVSRIHRTSGSTGAAMNIALSAADARMFAEVGARAMRLSGLGPGHRVVHCLNYQLWMGGYTDHAILEASGATVIPFGVGSSERLVSVIRDLHVTAIHCTPSYPAVLEGIIEDRFPGIKPRDLGLKLGLFGGEAGLDEAAFRNRLEEVWGFAVRNANYGVSDVLTIMAGQSETSNDLHFVATDVLYPEIVGPEDGQQRKWREGETGELVLTHLARECQPLIRFRTGDLITITGAAGGMTKFRVVGRADDMVVVRGLNMFPAMVQGVVSQFRELSGEYRITLQNPPPYDSLPLEAELSEGANPEGIATALESAIKRQLGGSARVTVLPPRSLPRSEGKARRVVRSY